MSDNELSMRRPAITSTVRPLHNCQDLFLRGGNRMICPTCGCEHFSSSRLDPISCVSALKRENEILRQLLCLTLADDLDEPGELAAGTGPYRPSGPARRIPGGTRM